MNESGELDVLDVSRFSMLEKSIGVALKPIIANYLTDCESALGALPMLITESNHDQVRFIAHRMKGASSSLGLPRLERGFAELEFAGIQRLNFQHDTVARLFLELANAERELRLRAALPVQRPG